MQPGIRQPTATITSDERLELGVVGQPLRPSEVQRSRFGDQQPDDVGVGAHLPDNLARKHVPFAGVSGAGCASFEDVDVDRDDHRRRLPTTGHGTFQVGVGERDQRVSVLLLAGAVIGRIPLADQVLQRILDGPPFRGRQQPVDACEPVASVTEPQRTA